PFNPVMTFERRHDFQEALIVDVAHMLIAPGSEKLLICFPSDAFNSCGKLQPTSRIGRVNVPTLQRAHDAAIGLWTDAFQDNVVDRSNRRVSHIVTDSGSRTTSDNPPPSALSCAHPDRSIL